jgi:glycosyltransferase involved in cell wall biosynthesis
MEPLVSIIIPGYNHERYVREAVESVVAQTYRNIELIFIDDASADSTFEIGDGLIRRNASRFVRSLSIKNLANKGAHATINSGIESSDGTYVAILNSDDFYLPGRIESLMTAMIKNESELGFSGVIPVDVTSSVISRSQLPPSLTDVFDRAAFTTLIYPSMGFCLLDRNIAVSTGNMLFSRRLYESLSGFGNFKYVHDWDFILRASLETEPVFVHKPSYSYRIHSTNSFWGLADIAEAEIDALTVNFFSAGRGGRVKNSRAAIPELWPGMYEFMAEDVYLIKRSVALGICDNSLGRLRYNSDGMAELGHLDAAMSRLRHHQPSR